VHDPLFLLLLTAIFIFAHLELNISSSKKQKIFYGNAKKIYKI